METTRKTHKTTASHTRHKTTATATQASRQAYLFMDGGVPRLTFHKDMALIEALINMYVCMYAG
jgi:hypothetical protein